MQAVALAMDDADGRLDVGGGGSRNGGGARHERAGEQAGIVRKNGPAGVAAAIDTYEERAILIDLKLVHLVVDEAGDGWLIRHVENMTRFVTEHPEKVRKDAWENACKLKQGFRRFWAKKVDHIQAVPFSENTKGKWGLRIEDVLADALVLGPLKNRAFDLPENVTQRLTELTPKGVPPEASILLYKYYVIHRTSRSDAVIPDWMLWPNQNDPPDSGRPFVILPMQNFNAFFGTTAFSQKWITALTGSILERKVLDGISKYRIAGVLL